MARLGVGLACVVLCLAPAASADAQSTGNGLYEPFPALAAKKRAKRFINEVRPQAAGVSEAELERGSFAGLAPTRSGAATVRAAGAVGPAGSVGWPLALALLALCAAPLVWAARRRG